MLSYITNIVPLTASWRNSGMVNVELRSQSDVHGALLPARVWPGWRPLWAGLVERRSAHLA